MIYTVTFNPSLDYIVAVDDFQLGLTNRTSSELILPGGKGINVSTLLMNLGIESTALGFMAGFTGDEIVRELQEMGVKSDFIRIDEGISRINLKLKSIDGTEINGSGPAISADKVEQLMVQLDALGEGDVLFLAGSIPSSMPDDMYRRIMARLEGKAMVLMPGAGYEGVTRFVMDVMTSYGLNACPPLLVGVGVATSVETAALLSKKALMRPLGSHNENERAASMEKLLEDGINEIGLGPQGMGGKYSVMGVHIENTARHPSAIGVAVNVGCWSHRRGHIIFDKDLNYTITTHSGVTL